MFIKPLLRKSALFPNYILAVIIKKQKKNGILFSLYVWLSVLIYS